MYERKYSITPFVSMALIIRHSLQLLWYSVLLIGIPYKFIVTNSLFMLYMFQKLTIRWTIRIGIRRVPSVSFSERYYTAIYCSILFLTWLIFSSFGRFICFNYINRLRIFITKIIIIIKYKFILRVSCL